MNIRDTSFLRSIISLYFVCAALVVQGQTDHWETVVYDSDQWRYFVGTSEPPSTWFEPGFDASVWQLGNGGFGYDNEGDPYLGTNVSAGTISIYFRKAFNIVDINAIAEVYLHLDYDDGFVAYLNGAEITRAGMGATWETPVYNRTADFNHEAQLKIGGQPSAYKLNKADLIEGENIIAIQVHNISQTSSDLTGKAFINVGISNTSTNYRPVPNWFIEPISFESSNLPIIKIATGGQEIPNEPRIVAQMEIINNGPGNRNYLTDPANDYNGRIEIETRGSSSQGFPKKNYRLETQDINGLNLNVELLGMPAENDWVIHGPYSDKSLMRNVLEFHIGNLMGRYAPRTRFAELLINDDYQGVVVLMETIKRDSSRVNIANLRDIDISGDELTGGYIFKVDRSDPQGGNWISDYETDGQYANYQIVYPKPGIIRPAQFQYIQNVVNDFETVILNGDINNPNTGFGLMADVGSFVDYWIGNEISNNVDGYRLSTFFYKHKITNGGKIVAGPLWDFNLAFGNADYCSGWSTNVWAYRFNNRCGSGVPFYWKRLMSSKYFLSQLKSRWEELRSGPLATNKLLNYIDSTALVLEEAQQRNFTKWPILGNYIWPNNFVGETYQDEIDYLKGWLISRLYFMDQEIPQFEVPLYYSDLIKYTTKSYPNPFESNFTVDFAMPVDSWVTMSLTNMKGQKVYEKRYGVMPMGFYKLGIFTDNLQPGTYILTVATYLRVERKSVVKLN